MKVVYIHHSGYFGGSSRSLGLFLPNLKALGVEPYIISPPGTAIDFFKKFTPNVIELNHRTFPLLMTVVGMKNNPFHFFRNYAMVKNIGKIQKIIEEIKPDIVHLNEWGLLPIAQMVKKMEIPVVMHARTMPDKRHPALNNYVLNRLDKFCDYLICITGSVHGVFKKMKNKAIIYNPVQTIALPNKNQTSSKEGNQINFLSLSAIHKTKGVFDILEAAKILKKDKRIKIYFAGKLNRHNNAKLSFKQKLLSKLGILDFEEANRFVQIIEDHQLDNVELLGHVDDIHEMMKKMDVMLAPMHLNAPPRSVYEAGIHEIPSILSMEDKAEDVIENGVNGILIDEQNPTALAEAMLKLANDPELRIRLGKEARKRFVKNHDAKQNATKIFSIYQQVLNNKKETPTLKNELVENS